MSISEATRKALQKIPSSLALPHGDPIPREQEPTLQRVRKPRKGEPSLPGAGPRGAYSSLGYTTVGYRSARIAEREGRSPSRTGAVVHERVDRLKLQYQSREFVRNNGLYAGIIQRTRNYVIGEGFKLQANTSSPAYNRKEEKLWDEWWTYGLPEIKSTHNGPLVEKQAVDEVFICGDVGIVLTNAKGPDGRNQIQLIEAEQIIGHDWLKQGIEKDNLGRPTKYWVSPYDPNSGIPLRAEAQSYTPEQFLHVCALGRVSSYRPVPPFQAGFPNLHRIDDTCNSEAMAWQIQSRVALIENRTSGLPVPNTNDGSPILDQENPNNVDGDAAEQYVTELDYALIFHGQMGETISGLERTAPGSNFPDAIRMFLRLLGTPMGLPLELILLDWTGGNFSQSKALLQAAFVTFIDWQNLFEFRKYRRIHKWWLEGEIAAGRLKRRGDQYKHNWIKNQFPWLDELQEAEAQGIKVDRGFGTYDDVCRSQLKEAATVREIRAKEIEEAIILAKGIEERQELPPGTVPWESFCGMQPPIRAAESITSGESGKPGENDKGSKPKAGASSSRAKPTSKPKSPREESELPALLSEGGNGTSTN